ncbi:MAG: SurA N-terminal domain-containing protein [Chromatiaceae bacterium]|jgi:peptidyl-prolyl cis-trans isomerase D|nr:SurA N-terminal domain-containing protein [Chromatiaceae bacterium]
MLQTIRERAQGWIAWAIVILISIPFALWGIQSYLGVGSEPVVAKVNSTEITEREFEQRYQQLRIRLREQLGAAFRPELFDDRVMRPQVLEQIISETLLLQVSHDMGLRASDAELRTAIMSNPSFQRDGRFARDAYERMLQLQGLNQVQYEEGLRQRIVGSQLERALIASELVTEHELKETLRLERQQRRLSYFRVPRADFVSDEPIGEDQIAAYYQANQDRFQVPERVRLRYLVLDASTMDPAQTPDEDSLRAAYEADVERFRRNEQRAVRHILVALPTDADSEAETDAKARIQAIRERILAGADFGAIARETSEDPGSAGQGGALGTFERGVMDPAFDRAAFALERGVLSEPVRSAFGYHLIEVTEVEEAQVRPFEEVRDELLAEASKRGAEGQFFEWAERLATLAYESPDSLEPAAEALGLELQTSEWLDRSGGEGILANRRVIGAAFSDEVLRQGLNSDVIEPEPQVLQAIVLRVAEHEEASARPLEQVRSEIVETLRAEQAAAAAQRVAEELAGRVRAGEPFAEVAGSYAVTDAGLVARDAAEVPDPIRSLAFTLPRPAEGATSVGSQVLPEGDAAVVVVSEIADGDLDALDAVVRAQQGRGLAQRTGSALFEDLLEDLQQRAKIERRPLRTVSGIE